MRRRSLVVVLALAASTASAQPAPDEAPAPAEPVAEPAPEPKVEPKPVPEPKVEAKASIARQKVAPKAEPEFDAGAEFERMSEQRDLRRDTGFRFGSYGRVLAGSDLRGGKAEQILIVAHGPRIVEPSYLELDFSYGFQKRQGTGGVDSYIVLRPVVTLAFDGTLFHDTGQFDAQPALRNMFLDARVGRDLTMWVGSRMYRGDDIYLFDYWPLDDQNTIGAGVTYSPKLHLRSSEKGEQADELSLAAHVGFNRLQNQFQFQQVDVPNPVQGATTVDQLNRQRVVASATAGYTMVPSRADMGAKLKLHAERHSIADGTRERMDGTLEALPADRGMLVGLQAGVFGFSDNEAFRRHLNVFARYANGLAAFDELAPPTSFGPDLKTNRANELTFGISGGFDHALGNVLVGFLSRRFIDADTTAADPDDGWEYAVDARPLARIAGDFYAGADISYQARFPRGLNPITLRAEDAAVFQLAPMIAFSPMGPSAYDRPQLRLFYRVAYLDQGARDMYVPDDPRHDHERVHFLGFAAEWWFNSSTYR